MSDRAHGSAEEAPLAWERHADEIAKVDPVLQPSFVAALARDVQLHASVKAGREELRAFRNEVAERDGRILASLARLEALGHGTAARVARLDKEREVTRDQVKEVHRWAEQIRHDAEESQQRAIVSAKEAGEAIARANVAEVGRAAVSAALVVSDDARRSFTNETTIIRTEQRGRRWQVVTIAIAAVLGTLSTLGAGYGVWRLTVWPSQSPPMTIQGK